MVAYLDALRHLVEVNLDAGAADDFQAANVIVDVRVQKAWEDYLVAKKGWNGDRIAGGDSSRWPAILRRVEAYVEKELRAA